jgi:PAS domain S-box-containing protein
MLLDKKSAIIETNILQILKKTFECCSDHILILGLEQMRFLYANPAALSSLGYTSNELLKLSPSEVVILLTKEKLVKAFAGNGHTPTNVAYSTSFKEKTKALMKLKQI